MRHSLSRLMLAAALICLASGTAFAQGSTTSSISGTVVDSGGGVIPGATVVVKNNATGHDDQRVTQRVRRPSTFPRSSRAHTRVTVSLSGFKTAVLNDVHARRSARRRPIKATLEVGNLYRNRRGQGRRRAREHADGDGLLDAQRRSDQQDADGDAQRAQRRDVPPGREHRRRPTAIRTSTGLPDSFVAISLDGVNNNDNFNKSTEGLFAMVTPRQDAVEAVTVTTAANGADVGGHGAVQVAFVTRSGTNRFTGSAYQYFRASVAQHQLLVQRERRAAEERHHAEPVRRAAGRPDRAARRL